jgi:hypothetical protein
LRPRPTGRAHAQTGCALHCIPDAISTLRSGHGPQTPSVSPERCSGRRRAPNFYTHVVKLSHSASDTIGYINQLGHVLVEGGSALSAVELIVPLESVLTEKWLDVLTEASGAARPTAASVVKAVLKDRPSSSDNNAGRPEALPDGDGHGSASVNAIEQAITQAPFRGVAAALRGIDTQTARGRLDAIAEGFNGKCVLTVRALLTPRPLHSKNESLALLADLHKHLAPYLTWVLVADDQGNIPKRLQDYSIVGPPREMGKPSLRGQAFLDSFLKFDLVGMDWLYAPGGLLALEAAKNGPSGGKMPLGMPVHPLDIYTVPDMVTALGGMIHALLVGVGAAQTVEDNDTDGYTFAEWTDMYVAHLKRANGFDLLELRYEHLDYCHQLFATSLATAGQRLRDAVFSQLPADKRIDVGVLPPGDEPPVSDLKKKEKAIETISDLRVDWQGVLPFGNPSNSASALPFRMPLRSENPAHATLAKAWSDQQREQNRVGPGKRKLGEEGSSLSLQTVSSGPPGSLTASWMWLQPMKVLFVSGTVFNVVAIAKKLGVSVNAKCWPWLLSRKAESNKPAICDHYGKAGHKSEKDVAHVLNPPIDLNAIMADPSLCRKPTDEERQKLAAQMEEAGIASTTGAAHRQNQVARGKGPGKGPGRGPGKGRGKGLGRGRGGQDFPPSPGF